MHLNKFEIIGRAGKDPEVINGTIGKFSVAVSDPRFNKDTNEWTDNVMWVNVVCFQKLAERIASIVQKGDLLYVEGKLEIKEHEGKYYHSLIAHTVRRLSKRGDGASNEVAQQKPQIPEDSPFANTHGKDSDLPF